MITLSYAMLGLLARGPLSGYDIIQRIERPLGFFWAARRSQIYPELARLERAGLVGHSVVRQQDRPDKKVFAITEQGREVLREWVMQPMEIPADHDIFMLRVFSAWLVEPAQAIEMFRRYARQREERVAMYLNIEQDMLRTQDPEQAPLDSPWFASYVTLHRGIAYERGYAEWCHWVANVIEERARR